HEPSERRINKDMRVWDPFRDLDAVRREVDRALTSVLADGGRAVQASFLPGRAARGYPLINIAEDKDSFFVEALAPGVNPSTFDLSVVKNTLTISGEKVGPENVGGEAFHRNERAAGKFVRSIELPAEVDGNRVSASYVDGLLTVTLAKAEAAKPKQIQ